MYSTAVHSLMFKSNLLRLLTGPPIAWSEYMRPHLSACCMHFRRVGWASFFGAKLNVWFRPFLLANSSVLYFNESFQSSGSHFGERMWYLSHVFCSDKLIRASCRRSVPPCPPSDFLPVDHFTACDLSVLWDAVSLFLKSGHAVCICSYLSRRMSSSVTTWLHHLQPRSGLWFIHSFGGKLYGPVTCCLYADFPTVLISYSLWWYISSCIWCCLTVSML
jgi:hypothetical protein